MKERSWEEEEEEEEEEEVKSIVENIIREPVLSDIALEYRETRQEGFISPWQQFFFVPRWRKSNYASPAKGFSSLRVLLDQRISIA